MKKSLKELEKEYRIKKEILELKKKKEKKNIKDLKRYLKN